MLQIVYYLFLVCSTAQRSSAVAPLNLYKKRLLVVVDLGNTVVIIAVVQHLLFK